MQQCRHKREQAAAYHTELPPLSTSYGMRDVRGGGGGRGTGVYGGRPSGNGSGSGFATGGGVNDYALRSPSPTPPTASVAANGLAFNNNANQRADNGLPGGVSNTAFYGPAGVDTGRAPDTGLPDQIPRATLGAPNGPPTTAAPPTASGTNGRQIRPPQVLGQQREDFV